MCLTDSLSLALKKRGKGRWEGNEVSEAKGRRRRRTHDKVGVSCKERDDDEKVEDFQEDMVEHVEEKIDGGGFGRGRRREERKSTSSPPETIGVEGKNQPGPSAQILLCLRQTVKKMSRLIHQGRGRERFSLFLSLRPPSSKVAYASPRRDHLLPSSTKSRR